MMNQFKEMTAIQGSPDIFDVMIDFVEYDAPIVFVNNNNPKALDMPRIVRFLKGFISGSEALKEETTSMLYKVNNFILITWCINSLKKADYTYGVYHVET